MKELTETAQRDERYLDFDRRAEAVLALVFHGLHNVPGKIEKTPAPYPMWKVSFRNSLSTYDFDGMTRLVIAAHDNCIRADISARRPLHLTLMLHPRKRDGGMSERHPTMESAIEFIRNPKR